MSKSYIDINFSAEELWKGKTLEKLDLKGDVFCKTLFSNIYRNNIIPLYIRNGLWLALNKTHMDTTWLERFNNYWTSILGGRPINGVLDFAYLYGSWRDIFYNYSNDIEYSSEGHLGAWQNKALVYQLVDLVYRESRLSYSSIACLISRYLPKNQKNILEFGSAIAPVTRALIDFGFKCQSITIADLPTYAFHYGCYRFNKTKNVKPVVLEKNNNFELPRETKYGLICCLEVFEHLPSPLKTINFFHDILSEKGILLFDYVKSDATGLDTEAGLEERKECFRFFEENFQVVQGEILDYSKSTSLTLLRKK